MRASSRQPWLDLHLKESLSALDLFQERLADEYVV